MMMKKILIAALALAVVACGDDQKKSTNNQTGNNQNNNPNNPVNNPNNPVNNPNNPVNNPNNPVNNPNNTNNPENNTNNPENNTNNPINNMTGELDLGPDDKTLAELTDAEAVAACKTTEAYFYNNARPYDCYLDGLFEVFFEEPETAEEAQLICAEAEAECLTDPIDDAYCDDETAPDCPVTLGQLEACFTAMVAQYAGLGTPSCDTVTPETEIPEDLFDFPEECDVVEEMCPEFFGG